MINLYNADIIARDEPITTNSHLQGHMPIESSYTLTSSLQQLDSLYKSPPELTEDLYSQHVTGIDYNRIMPQPTDTWAVPTLGYMPNTNYKRINPESINTIMPLIHLDAVMDPAIVGHQRNDFGDIMAYVPLGMGQTPTKIDTTISPIGISAITEAEQQDLHWYTDELPWGFHNFTHD